MVNTVFNPAATVFEGETLLLVRVEFRSGLSHLAVAKSPNGRSDWTIDHDRRFEPRLDTFEEQWGIEDPRITKVGDEYMIVYTGYSAGGPLVCLATTTDFRTYECHGVLMSPEDKDAGLFPVQFGGRWAQIHDRCPGRTSESTCGCRGAGPPALGDASVLLEGAFAEGGGMRTRSASGHRRCSRRTGG